MHLLAFKTLLRLRSPLVLEHFRPGAKQPIDPLLAVQGSPLVLGGEREQGQLFLRGRWPSSRHTIQPLGGLVEPFPQGKRILTAAADRAGANDGVAVGNPLGQPAGGKVGGALQLDGIDDYVRIPVVVDPAKDPFSIFAWIKSGAPRQVVLTQTGTMNWLMGAKSKHGLIRAGRFATESATDMRVYATVRLRLRFGQHPKSLFYKHKAFIHKYLQTASSNCRSEG